MALGDSAIRILAIDYLIKSLNLDAKIIPHSNSSVQQLWRDVFQDKLIGDENNIPSDYQAAIIHAPTSEEWARGQSAYTTFETVFVENGFDNIVNPKISAPNIYSYNPDSHSVMIYPNERTDGNRIYNNKMWLDIYYELKTFGYKINCLGEPIDNLREFYNTAQIDNFFPPTIDGLRTCIAASSLAVGTNTGPTWACLFSEIPQICLASNKSPHSYWDFDKCQTVLAKKLHIIPTMESVLRHLTSAKQLSLSIRQQLEQKSITPLIVRVSHYNISHPYPEIYLCDNTILNTMDKWATDNTNAWLEFVFTNQYIDKIRIFHAGILEDNKFNTKDYDIFFNDTSLNIRNNTSNITEHVIKAKVNKIKINILTPTQINDGSSRIYEVKFLCD